MVYEMSETSEVRARSLRHSVCQYLYFCTSKASTFVLVKQVKCLRCLKCMLIYRCLKCARDRARVSVRANMRRVGRKPGLMCSPADEGELCCSSVAALYILLQLCCSSVG